jgi:hypothetical protein
VSAARLVLGVLCVLAAGWLLLVLFRPRAEPAPARRFESSAECQACHADAYAEWSASQHAVSWTNPAVRMLSNDFANQDCIDCHAPRPIFETGIGQRVLPRDARRVEGVDCIACHALPEDPGGGAGFAVAGTRDAPGAACRPQATRELGSVEFCAGCHDQHQTVQQWRASSYAAQGVDCLDCHMPERAGGGRDHRFHGGNSLEMLQRAVELSGERRADGAGGWSGWSISVANVGAGHSFPTDERSRAADVFWRPLAAAGSEPGSWRHAHRFRSPYRFETELADTLLAAGATEEISLAEPEASGAIEVALFYKRSPYWLDPSAPDPEREAVLVHRLVLEP